VGESKQSLQPEQRGGVAAGRRQSSQTQKQRLLLKDQFRLKKEQTLSKLLDEGATKRKASWQAETILGDGQI